MASKNNNCRNDVTNVSDWMQYINKFPEPKSDLERMRFQFLTQRKYGKIDKFFLNSILAIFAFIPAFLIMCVKSIHVKRYKADAILFCTKSRMSHILENDLPQDLQKEFPNRVLKLKNDNAVKRMIDGVLDFATIKNILKVIIRYPFSFYMNFYYLMHVAYICKLKKCYSPKAIISIQTELDFSTSMLTNYCESNSIEYIGVAHGEYILNLERAFVRFTRYYAWNNEMIELFYLTRSPHNGFFVYQTNRLAPIYKKQPNPEFFISYYLDDQSIEEIEKLKVILVEFTKKGYMCKIRVHPRAGDLQETKRIFEGTSIYVENPRDVPLSDSIENSRYIVSTFSTVLREAYASGFDVVIDDMNDIITIEAMKEVKYSLLDKTDLRLSDLYNNLVKN